MKEDERVGLCPSCGSPVSCGMEEASPCWCVALPALLPLEDATACLCRTRLLRRLQDAIASWLQAHPLPQAVPAPCRSGDPVEGLDYYLEGGYLVFTEWYHRRRGYCCGSGCRHCPWRSRA